MRASRLITILTTLQARGHTTAQALADACEVSLRTIYRDIEALSAAGIPVYSERGSEGGYRLLDGYRTQLNGLSEKEAEALFISGLSGPAADLGLGTVMAAARLKLLAALPSDLRAGAERMQARFHLDAPAWFSEAEQPAWLPAVANAVWEQQRLRLRYESWKGERERTVEPLGLVLKGGAWYLIAQIDGDARTYRVSRIQQLAVLDERFTRPAPFDLAEYWRLSTQRFETEMHTLRATIRFSPRAFAMLEHFVSPFARSSARIVEIAADGWTTAELSLGPVQYTHRDLLQFGAEIEVLEPLELRAAMTQVAQQLAALYPTCVIPTENR